MITRRLAQASLSTSVVVGRSRFAADSLLEGDGFEPSVPVEGGCFCCGRRIAGDRTGAGHKELFLLRGTDGSNPSSSSGELSTNRTAPEEHIRSGPRLQHF